MKKRGLSKRRSKRKKRVFSPYTVYQPIIEIQSHKIMGFEALARANSKRSLPEAIFRQAYRDGSAMKLDLGYIRSALKILPKLSKDLYLFVNVEPVTLGYAFREGSEIASLLKKYKRYTRQIIFEITERMRVWDFKFVEQGIAFLKKRKCRFALDDVSGVDSELLRLLSHRPEFIKVDMDLVRNITRRPLNQEYFRKLVFLARKKKVRLIVEGIERKSDLEYVRCSKVFLVQGYYFAKPHRELCAELTPVPFEV